jgi:hypothetical protein
MGQRFSDISSVAAPCAGRAKKRGFCRLRHAGHASPTASRSLLKSDLDREGVAAGIAHFPELRFDAQELVVLGHTV